ncbi:hypothetical protein ACX9Q3_002180 [Klebsiella oxytoca]|uniref:hypothetical protein n=1 Tax=Klebsiella/Raoultella group TaxID=2890311 RepID=UPI000BFB3C70|nr:MULTISPECIES: hypothetical protein [Klebsiella]HAU4449206.1 hypothetical protein [Citrobacter freundii]HBR1132771.1 hypothetical protein [Klebsiella quasipneumoniae subsp. similipneumoniae]EIX9725641.1 hypothetical protein [Klebsiella pneumoniae]EKM7489788.1 hypothetical protein [Klebsiella pneumoniae]EKV3344243.1 hypothetical protein [Klebsiella pneumoniae]
MLYMLTCLVIMVYVMYLMVTTLKDKLENLDDSRVFRPGALTTFATMGAVILLLSPLYMTMVSDSLSQNASLFTQWAGLAGGLLLVGVYGWLFLKRRAFSSGLISICGATLIFIFANSLLFVSSSNTGVLNFGFISQMTTINDVECESGMMAVNLADKGHPSEWRCPQGFVLLGMSSRPFIPWPTYSTGKSLELTDAIHTMMDSAQTATEKKD